MKNILKLIVSVVISQAAGAIGSLFTIQNIPTWYAGLNKPSFNPPNYLFGPVWITLYFIMGIAFFLVWKQSETRSIKVPAVLFVIQLLLNSLWSILFFGMKNPALGFMEIILLWIFIVLCIVKFYPVSKPAAWLMLPYLLWVSFASVLNFKIWMLN
jgi:tryptophan-rich sensory protein